MPRYFTVILWLYIDYISAKEYNEDCAENEQCKPLLGELGKCVDEKCTCENHLQFSNGKCHQKKGIY